MASKKKTSKKVVEEKTLIEKIGDKASHLKEDIIAGTGHLAELAGDAFESVKSTIQHITQKKKKAAKKVAKASPKKAAAKAVSPASKKTASKSTRPAGKLVKKAVTKKTAPSKKVAKKAAPKK